MIPQPRSQANVCSPPGFTKTLAEFPQNPQLTGNCWLSGNRWNHTLEEETNLSRCRNHDLRETFAFLELSNRSTNPQMKTPQRLVYKHFAAIEMACDTNVNSLPV